jgi:hypothetical protein
MVIPWGLTGVLVILRGTPVRLDVLAFGLALDAVLLFFAWRKPWGVATCIVVLRFLLYAVLDLWVGHRVLLVVYGTFDAVAAVVLAAMIVAMQGDRRRRRAELRQFEARIDADGPWEVRQASQVMVPKGTTRLCLDTVPRSSCCSRRTRVGVRPFGGRTSG